MKAGAAEISRVSLPKQIADLMRRDIFTGVYKPGERLPSERDLAENFGAARTTIRKTLAILDQERWIKISHGKNIVVNDFRTTVGFEALTNLFLTCPAELLDEEFLETVAESIANLRQQIFVAAAKKAKPEDKPRLLEILEKQTDQISLTELFENEFELGHEILRIGDNIILQVGYNSHVRLTRKLLSLGWVRERPFPIAELYNVNLALINAICSGNTELVRKLSRDFRQGLEDVFKRSMNLSVKQRR